MHIGLDFDNTIVSYDSLFYQVAVEQNLIPPKTPVNKVAVRDYLRQTDQEAIWTEMQGYVYGSRMDEAHYFPGLIDFLQKTRQAGHTHSIVSHKTQYPFLGPQYDLHQAARQWIQNHLVIDQELLIPANQIYFEISKAAKIARIAQISCDVFIDDLPEILQDPAFPNKIQKVLFDPEQHHNGSDLPELSRFSHWDAIALHLNVA